MLNQFKNIFSSPLSNQEDISHQKKGSYTLKNSILAESLKFQIQEGDKLYHRGELEQALIYYDRAVEIDGNSAQAHQKLAMALQKQGNLPQAMIHYRKAIVLNNARENFEEKKQSVELQVKNFEQDLKKSTQITASKSFELSSPLISTRYPQPYQESITQSAFVPAEKVTPNLKREAAEIYLQQALAYGDEQKWQEVINACQHAVQIIPDLAEAYKLWGNALQRMGKTSEAMGFYAKALEIQPDLAEVYANLGSLYAQKKKWQKAGEYYQKAVIIKPNFPGVYRNLAKVWKELGEPEKAAECYQKSLSLEPKAVNATEYILAGDRLIGESKPEQAIEYYLQAIKLSPDSRISYKKAAETWEKLGKWQEAATYYRQMLKLKPDSSDRQPKLPGENTVYALPSKQFPLAKLPVSRKPLQLSLAGQIDSSQHDVATQNNNDKINKLDIAIAKYEQKAQEVTDSAPLQANLGSLYAQKQDWQKAAQFYQKAIELNPNMAGAYRNLAKVLEKLGKEVEAAKCWYQAFSIEPQSADAEQHYQLGDTLFKQNQLEKAITCYRRALELEPNSARAYFQIGEVLNKLGKWDEAVIAYARALKLDKNIPSIYQKLGNVIQQRIKLDKKRALELYLHAIQQQPENEEVYLKAIEIKSDEPELYLKLGNILLQHKRVDEAIFAYSRAIELQPENSELRLKLGDILIQQEQWDNAIDCYTQAIKVNPNSDSAHLALGKVLIKQNQLDKAVEYLRQATKLNPNLEEPYQYLAEGLCQQGNLDEASIVYFKLGEILSKEGRLNEAISAFNRTLQINPNYYWAYHCLGNIYVWQDKLDEAVFAYRKAIELQPDLAASYKNLGDVLAKQGKVEEASEAYRQALQFDSQVIQVI